MAAAGATGVWCGGTGLTATSLKPLGEDFNT